MNIVLFGYGKMGKEIEKIAKKRNHKIVLIIDESNADLVTINDLLKGDVAIEFSTPKSTIQNIKKCFESKLPIVIGTTGWYNEFEAIKKLCIKKKGSMFYATNFSLGVNLFFKLNTYLAKLMNSYKEYDVSIEEIHHLQKIDTPSGTAISIANQIIDKIDRKKKWTREPKSKSDLLIKDFREGDVPGTHTIKYKSDVDDIEIVHTAHNRKGFALGAIIAAEFLQTKKGVFTMNDLIS